jgi:hypothetical protein
MRTSGRIQISLQALDDAIVSDETCENGPKRTTRWPFEEPRTRGWLYLACKITNSYVRNMQVASNKEVHRSSCVVPR